ncbi:uncharacterized protein LOC142976813 [Anticarsia gemmatalis]|uniref:uncharacterized protein LOC142976813 n=1 Tax=Anticarsia gemmatalis TaxID=129554 RepID=UPI003F765890
MFYQYFYPFNLICNVFGLLRHPINGKGKSTPSNWFIKLWCVIVSGLFIASFCLSMKFTGFKIKYNLEIISDINDLTANVFIMVVNLLSSGKVSVNLHKTFDLVFKDFNFEPTVLKLFALKIYFWFSIPTVIFFLLIIMEIMSRNLPYDLMIRIPTFLSSMYLFMHLYVILSLLKVINIKLSSVLINCERKILFDDNSKSTSSLKYVLNPAIKFDLSKYHGFFDIKTLCKIYDNLCTSIHLLEQNHGFEILLSVWLMFTSGVVGMTLIVCNQASIKWLVCVKSILPFFWSFIGCCIAEQLRSEVELTMTFIIKCLIDYRCVPTMKPDLETFKELVSNDRLDFNACNLFHLNYALLLGTILNVITYSIILIQMFLN